MMSFLIGGLLILVIVAGVMISQIPANSVETVQETEENPEEGYEITYASAIAKPRKTIDFETHPVERIKLLYAELPEIKEKTFKFMDDPEMRSQFEDSLDEVELELEELDPDAVISALLEFPPIQNSYYFSVDTELISFLETITDILFSLPNQPQRIETLESYLRALRGTAAKLGEMVVEYKKLRRVSLSPELTEELIVNDVKILSNMDLCEIELEKFFEFYYGLKAYLSLGPILGVTLKQISEDLDKILETLYQIKSLHTKEHVQSLGKLQQSILQKMRSYCTHYHRLFSSVLVGLENLQETNLKELVHMEDVLQKAQESLEEEYLPISESFAIGRGTMESEFHKYLQKLTHIPSKASQPEPVSIGTLESSVSYFEKRSEEMRLLNDPKPVKSVHHILESVITRIKRYQKEQSQATEENPGE